MPSLPLPSMSTSTLIDDKYASQQKAAMAHIKQTHSLSSPSRRKSKSKSPHKKTVTTISIPITSPPMKDFILFPDNAADKSRVSSNDARGCDGMRTMPSPGNANVAATAPEFPRRRRVQRHGGFRIVAMNDDFDDKKGEVERETREKKTPPSAPSPPALDSPCLSDVDDDDFWGCWRREGRKENRDTAA